MISAEFGLAALVTAAATYGGLGNELFESPVGEVITPLLTYAAIALGFTLGSTALALTFPGVRFTKSLVLARVKSRTAYADLIFIFVWCSVAHWATVVLCLAIAGRLGTKVALMGAGSSVIHQLGVSLLLFATTYGVLLFLIALLTLGRAGMKYVDDLVAAHGGT